MIVAWVALANVITGLVYTTYGLMTIAELRRHWRTRGPSHFGLAWVAMAFTCGPHHLEHGLHVLVDGTAGTVDLIAITVGLPAGIIFFLLRVEAMRGGTGDRTASETLGAIITPAVLGAASVAAAVAATRALEDGLRLSWTLAPNLLLVGLYLAIAATLAATQAHNRAARGTWSLSGLSLTVVFVTCAVMHGSWVVHVSQGLYEVHGHLVAIDVLAVPAAIYFLWVVGELHRGRLPDWNELAPAAERDLDVDELLLSR